MALRAGALRLLTRTAPSTRSLSSGTPSPAARSVSTFSLPDLKYGYAALEPYFDEKTMTVCGSGSKAKCADAWYACHAAQLTAFFSRCQSREQIHHTRHHQTYVSNLNGVLTGDHGTEIQVSFCNGFWCICSLSICEELV